MHAQLMNKQGLKILHFVFLPLFVFHTHKQKHKLPLSDTRLVHNVPLSYFGLQDKGFLPLTER